MSETSPVVLHRALRAEWTLVWVRWGALLFAILQVVTFYTAYEPGVLPYAVGLLVLLAVGNAVINLYLRRGVDSYPQARRLGTIVLAFDVIVVMGLVVVYTFDEHTMMFALVYLLPLEAALRFQLRGALTTMGVVAALYTLREVYGARVWGNDFLPESITFRMGIGFLIAWVSGQMASQLIRDRTELEAAQVELRRAAEALEATNFELAAANDVKDDFLAMTNHELRTPLTTVLGYTSLLRKRWEAIPDQRRLEFIARIEEQGLRLQEMVESLLTVISAEEGGLQVRLEDVDLCRAVDEAIFDQWADTSEVINACPSRLAVRADPVRLGQIMSNLLSNARKYGAPPITVSVREDERWVTIVVEDAGAGVPEWFVPRLFHRFSQASIGDSRTAEGTGLGLSIVAQLAEAQGGEAWYEPREPHGAAFCVRLQRSPRGARTS